MDGTERVGGGQHGTSGVHGSERPGDHGLTLAERLARAESALAQRTEELRAARHDVLRAMDRHDRLRRAMPGCLVCFRPDGTVTEVNPATESLVGRPERELVGSPVTDWFVAGDGLDLATVASACRRHTVYRSEKLLIARDCTAIPVLVSAAAVFQGDAPDGFVAMLLDQREQKSLEAGLRHAQKLEAVGHLAAGIAHEINTPSQYIGDSVWFVQKAVDDLDVLLRRYRTVARANADAETLASLDRAESDARLDYLQREVPDALASALSGIRRIDEIVSAMQSFARPNRREKSPADLNQSIRTALTIARHAYKYVAEVDVSLGVMPMVRCFVGDVHQVLATLLLHATDAVQQATAHAGGGLGRISVRSRYDEATGEAVIEVEDSGAGIAPEHLHRVFAPSGTSRGAGHGSAQSLFIARQIAVERHGGSLSFHTAQGRGTTFTLRLPRDGGGRTYSEVAS